MRCDDDFDVLLLDEPTTSKIKVKNGFQLSLE